MDSVSEADMSAEPSGYIQAFWFVESCGIVICRCDFQNDKLTLFDGGVANVGVLARVAEDRLHDAGIAQQFLGGTGHKAWILNQSRNLIWILQQCKPCIGKKARQRLRQSGKHGLAYCEFSALEQRVQSSFRFL